MNKIQILKILEGYSNEEHIDSDKIQEILVEIDIPKYLRELEVLFDKLYDALEVRLRRDTTLVIECVSSSADVSMLLNGEIVILDKGNSFIYNGKDKYDLCTALLYYIVSEQYDSNSYKNLIDSIEYYEIDDLDEMFENINKFISVI